MLLKKDASPGALTTGVRCVVCGKWYRLFNMWADLGGRAFVDYYCDNCARKYKGVARYINEFNVDTLARADSGEVEGEGVSWENARYAYNKLQRANGEGGELVGLERIALKAAIKALRAVAEAAETVISETLQDDMPPSLGSLEALRKALAAWREVDKGTSVRGSIGGV